MTRTGKRKMDCDLPLEVALALGDDTAGLAEHLASLGQPTTRKRKVDGVALAKKAIKAGLDVDTVLQMPDGGALLTFGRKSDADTDDAEHIETAEELRALI